MRLVLDVETTFQIIQEDKKKTKDPSPYDPANKLVYVGITAPDLNIRKGWWFNHSTAKPDLEAKKEIQELLDRCTLLIGHNLKFDLQWLLECGFKIPDKIWDTMLAEYVLARGLKPGMSLDASCLRHGLPVKHNVKDEYFDKDVTPYDMPEGVLAEYCLNDIDITWLLYLKQTALYVEPANAGLIPTLDMMNEFCLCLTEVERNGIYIDQPALVEIDKGYKEEEDKLTTRIKEIVSEVMGDTPINLDSPEQLSWVIYSRKVKNKPVWAELFNLGSELRGSVKKKKYPRRMSKAEFVSNVKENTEWLYKTRAEQCRDCGGRGRYLYTTKKGEQSKSYRICKTCDSLGYRYIPLPKLAGLKVIPTSSEIVTTGGFSTGGDDLEVLAATAGGPAKEFLTALTRLNSIRSYRTTFVQGIRKSIKPDKLLHTSFMQCVTSTARLSSRNPNFQNMPRNKTFPIRRVVISRFKDGKILDLDYGKLEFVAAVFLSGDKQGLEDIANDFDVHAYTSNYLTERGEETDRQDAKPTTFRPLYGGSNGTTAIKEYCKHFVEKYRGIGEWHIKLQDEAINTKKIRLPSGREYAFPNVKRMAWGGVSSSTQIKNYPVQGFATGDLVPCAVVDVWRIMKQFNSKSYLILTVHDSISLDVHPDEIDWLPQKLKDSMMTIDKTLKIRYNIDWNIPLQVEAKIGDNWGDGKKI